MILMSVFVKRNLNTCLLRAAKVYEKQGWDTKLIEERCTDTRMCPIAGLTYRVPVLGFRREVEESKCREQVLEAIGRLEKKGHGLSAGSRSASSNSPAALLDGDADGKSAAGCNADGNDNDDEKTLRLGGDASEVEQAEQVEQVEEDAASAKSESDEGSDEQSDEKSDEDSDEDSDDKKKSKKRGRSSKKEKKGKRRGKKEKKRDAGRGVPYFLFFNDRPLIYLKFTRTSPKGYPLGGGQISGEAKDAKKKAAKEKKQKKEEERKKKKKEEEAKKAAEKKEEERRRKQEPGLTSALLFIRFWQCKGSFLAQGQFAKLCLGFFNC